MWTCEHFLGEGRWAKLRTLGVQLPPVGNLWEKHKLRLSSGLQDTVVTEFRFKDKA